MLTSTLTTTASTVTLPAGDVPVNLSGTNTPQGALEGVLLLNTENLMDSDTFDYTEGAVVTHLRHSMSRRHEDVFTANAPETDTHGSRRIFARGPRINPPLENGKCYRILQSILVQYWDNEHADRRNREDVPFDIIAGTTGEAWLIPNDALQNIPSDHAYIEVVAPSQAKPINPVAEDDEEEVPVTVEREDQWLASVAETNEDGTFKTITDAEFRAVQNGTSHLLWKGDRPTEAFIARHFGSEVYLHGKVRNADGVATKDEDHRARWLRPEADEVSGDDLRIAPFKVVDRQPAADSEPPATQARAIVLLNEHVAAAAERWEKQNVALIDMAKNHDWCSEFEESVIPLGFEGRDDRKVERDWNVDVEVDFTVEDSAPTSSQDRIMTDMFDLPSGASLSEITARGTVTVSGTVTAEDEDSARDMVDTEWVEEQMSGSYSIDDWSISDIEECD